MLTRVEAAAVEMAGTGCVPMVRPSGSRSSARALVQPEYNYSHVTFRPCLIPKSQPIGPEVMLTDISVLYIAIMKWDKRKS